MKSKHVFILMKKGIDFFLHLLAGGVIFTSWIPIAEWYYQHRPILGVDFFNAVTYASYLARHMMFRINGWKYFWYGGTPLETDYPTFLFLPLGMVTRFVSFFSSAQLMQLYMLLLTFLFLLGVYAVVYLVSKSKLLSVLLTVGTAWSFGLYGALVWGGSLPYYGTQLFFPWTLFFLLYGLIQRKGKFIALAAVIAGMSTASHPQIFFTYITIATTVLLLSWVEVPFSFRKNVVRWVKYVALSVTVAAANIFTQSETNPLSSILWFIGSLLSALVGFIRIFFTKLGLLGSQTELRFGGYGIDTTSSAPSEEIVFQRQQLRLFLEKTNDLFFAALIVAAVLLVITFLIRRKKKEVFRIFPYLLVAGAITGYIAMLGFGINFFHGGWYRVFWAFPVVLALAIGAVWREFLSGLQERIGEGKRTRVLFSAFSSLVVLCIVLAGTLLVFSSREKFWQESQKLHGEIEYSSAYPRILNGIREKASIDELLPRLHPSWLDPSDRQYRLYDADAQVNIWWNAYFDLPLARGYIDPPIGTHRKGGFFWLDTTFNRNEATEVFKKPEEIARNDGYFLTDWYGIRYISALHQSDNYVPLSSYLDTEEFIQEKTILKFPDIIDLYDLKTSQDDPRQLFEASTLPIVLWHVDNGGGIDRILKEYPELYKEAIFMFDGSAPEKIQLFPDLNRFSVIVTRAEQFERFSLFPKMMDYIQQGGTVIVSEGSYESLGDSFT